MALLHPYSSESVHSGLDFFSLPVTQTAVQDGLFVEYHPLSSLSSGAPIEFTISGGTSDYLDLHNTFLHVRAKITKADGTNLDADNDVAPVNMWMHALFSQVDMTLNDVLVTPSENVYPYRCFIETLLNYGKEAKKSHLTTEFYYADTPGYIGDATGNDNIGLKKRRYFTKESKEIDMMGKLHLDFMHQERYMVNGVDVKLRLIPSKNVFNLMSSTDGFKSVITHASLYVRKIKLNPAVALSLEKALLLSNCKYPMKRVIHKSFAIPKGNLSTVHDNLFLSQTPTKVVIGLVENAAFNGSYNKNPFHFQHFNISYFALYLNGRQIPSKALTPDFSSKQYVRSYHSLMLAAGLVNNDAGNGITYEEYGKGLTLFGFDLSPSLLDGSQFELIKSESLRLEIKFSKPLSESVIVFCYSELDSVIEIDHARQVLVDFGS